MRRLDIELKDRLAVCLEIPNKQGAFLDRDGVLAEEEFMAEDIFHTGRLHDILASIDLPLSDQFLLLDIVDPDFLEENLEVIFVVVGVAEEPDAVLS